MASSTSFSLRLAPWPSTACHPSSRHCSLGTRGRASSGSSVTTPKARATPKERGITTEKMDERQPLIFFFLFFFSCQRSDWDAVRLGVRVGEARPRHRVHLLPAPDRGPQATLRSPRTRGSRPPHWRHRFQTLQIQRHVRRIATTLLTGDSPS